MASLRDRINTTLVRRGGKLVEEATPTSQLAGQAGLVAPPTTPVGVGALGGTPQQQAMAGSPNQKASALRQSTDTVNTIQEAEADKRYRSAMTAGEQDVASRGKQLQEKLGTTQEKVQSLVDAEVAKLGAQAGPQLTTAGTLTAAGANATTAAAPEQQAAVDAAYSTLLSSLAGGTALTDPSVQKQLNELVKLTGLSTAELTQRVSDAAAQQATTQAGGAAATALGDTITVAQSLESLGTTREELAQLLGVPPEQIDTMSLNQLSAAVSGVTEQGGDMSVRQTEEMARSRQLGAAEREALREQSAEQSAAGVAAAEAELLDLSNALDSADTVTFGGHQYTVKELLSDDSISQMISDYLLNPNSPESKALAEDPNSKPLLDFAEKYRTTLTDAAKQVGSALTENEAIQTANAELASWSDSPDALPVPDSVMQSLYGADWKERADTRREPTGLISTLRENPEWARENSAGLNELFTLVGQNADLGPQISKLSRDELQGLLAPGAGGKRPLDVLVDTNRTAAALRQASGDVDALLGLYFGVGTDQSEIADLVKLNAVNNNKLTAKQRDYANMLDPDRDGIPGPDLAGILQSAASKRIRHANEVSEVLGGATLGMPKPAGLFASVSAGLEAVASEQAARDAEVAAAEEARRAEKAAAAERKRLADEKAAADAAKAADQKKITDKQDAQKKKYGTLISNLEKAYKKLAGNKQQAGVQRLYDAVLNGTATQQEIDTAIATYGN